MSLKVKKYNKVLAGDRMYKAGEIIPPLDETEEQRLLELGVCELAPDIRPAQTGLANDEDSMVNPPGLAVGGQLPLVGLVLSVEEFAELKADEQKAHLKALTIEPAGKEEDRIAQYEEWYANQLPLDGDLNVQL
ncbi:MULTISPECIES: hypothetical protein [unclassified Paenibacillus]|uniref:hypothetical protein n=1 Tax=unclassified Paenibacillus TaxID=185978 RepID=UPI0030FAB88F